MTVPLTAPAGSFTALSTRTGEALELAMQRLWLTGQVTPFGARLLVEHTFESAERRPVEVIYAFMLPQDAALRSFRVASEGFEINSDLRPVEEAVAAYEKGIDAGSLAILTRQYADGMMNLTVGNLRPGENVRVILEILAGVERHDNGFRFRFPFTLAPAYHREARSVALPGGGEMELPRETFGDLMLPTWKEDASNLHGVGFELELLGGQGLTAVTSPSHALAVAGEGSKRRVSLAVEAEVPNRDLVLEARAAEPWVLAWAAEGSISALLGSVHFGEPDEDSPRRLVFVLDRSGSMSGRPIEQAKKAIEGGIAALRADDRFSIVAFDHEVDALSPELLEASDANRQRARSFLSQVQAGGGTELADGITAAAKLVARGGGDLLLLTDGQVFGTAEILQAAREAGARIHALGLGSASQDRFLSQLGQDTGGRSRFLTPRERVDLGLLDLFAAVSPPLASEVRARANGQTLMADSVYAGQPMLLRQEATGSELEISWADGRLTLPVGKAPPELSRTLRLLEGAAQITAAESRILGKPESSKMSRLEALSRRYGLASRAMALVAVVERESDRPGELPQTRVVPVGLPQDLQTEAYFGRAEDMPALASMGVIRRHMLLKDAAPGPPEATDWSPLLSAFSQAEAEPIEHGLAVFDEEDNQLLEDEEDDQLLEDAARLEADGGLPGSTPEVRVGASLDLLERLLDEGSTRSRGAFRHHVRRLLEFLSQAELDPEQAERLAALEERAAG